MPIWFDLKGPKVRFLAQGNPQRERERERETPICVEESKIVHSHHSQQQSNCCTNERGRMGKKSRGTKPFSLYFAKPVQPYRFPVL